MGRIFGLGIYACARGGEVVGVFGSAGGAVPWTDWFLCDEDCSRELLEEVRLRYQDR